MQRVQNRSALGVALAAVLWPAMASAQTANTNDLLALDKVSLRGEIGTRYDAALAFTKDAGVVAADDNRFMWASQAKAQCGIATGFLKSGIKDPVSIGKCVDAYNRMQNLAPAAAPTVVVAPPPPVVCNKGPYLVFFDWDKSDLTAETSGILESMGASYPGCGGATVSIVGYADRSGSDRYNVGLSERRAATVMNYLANRGVPVSVMSTQGLGESNPRVPTADGVRELQNRRVEITVN